MGIPKAWEVIASTGELRSLLAIAEDGYESPYRGLRVAIDASIWMFLCQRGREGFNPMLRTFYFKLAKLLSLGILAVFVFDGPHRPAEKRGKTIYGRMSEETKKVIHLVKLFAFPVHVAPGEAEAECASLQMAGRVDYVMSDDVDCFAFGATRILRNWEGEPGQKNSHTMTFHSDKVLQETGLDRYGFIFMALASGGDYDTVGILRCGVKIAQAMARADFGRRLIEVVEQGSGLDAWRKDLAEELRTNARGLMERRQPSLANAIPLDFPDIRVLQLYCQPTVTPVAELPVFVWKTPPDLQQLANAVQSYFQWGNILTINRLGSTLGLGIVNWILRARVLAFDIPKEWSTLRAAGGQGSKIAKGMARKAGQDTITKYYTDSTQSAATLEAPNEMSCTILDGIHGSRSHVIANSRLQYRVGINLRAVLGPLRNLIELAEQEAVDITPVYESRTEAINSADSDSSSLAEEEEPIVQESSEDVFGPTRQIHYDGESNAPAFNGQEAGDKVYRQRVLIDLDKPMRTWVMASLVQASVPEMVSQYEAQEAAKAARRTPQRPTKTRNGSQSTLRPQRKMMTDWLARVESPTESAGNSSSVRRSPTATTLDSDKQDDSTCGPVRSPGKRSHRAQSAEESPSPLKKALTSRAAEVISIEDSPDRVSSEMTVVAPQSTPGLSRYFSSISVDSPEHRRNKLSLSKQVGNGTVETRLSLGSNISSDTGYSEVDLTGLEDVIPQIKAFRKAARRGSGRENGLFDGS